MASAPIEFKEVGALICQGNWTPGLFEGAKRNKANFKEAHVVALDVDEGCSVEQAIEILGDYQCMIGTTRSHMKEKNGKVAERFRVIIQLSRPVNAEEYEATVRHIANDLGFVDTQALDCSRFFYPCQSITYHNKKGALLEPEIPRPAGANEIEIIDRCLKDTIKGSLSRATLEFMSFGAEPGQRNQRLFKAVVDMNEQGYDIETAQILLDAAATKSGLTPLEIVGTIKSAYKRAPKYDPRYHVADKYNLGTEERVKVNGFDESLIVTPSQLADGFFDYLADKELVKGQSSGIPDLDKLLGGGFRKGELNVWHAIAKTGKNSLWHAMMYRMMVRFQLPIGYASREMTPETEVLPNLLSIAFRENAWESELTEERRAKYTEELNKWPMYFARGYGYFDLEHLRAWVKILKREYQVEHFFFDHLHFMLAQPEDHAAASLLIKDIKTLAKDEDVCIHLIVQPNKLMSDQELSLNSLKGGAAIGQALDNLLILTRKTGDPSVSKIILEQARHKLAKPGHFYLRYDSTTTDFELVDLEPPPLTADELIKRSARDPFKDKNPMGWPSHKGD